MKCLGSVSTNGPVDLGYLWYLVSGSFVYLRQSGPSTHVGHWGGARRRRRGRRWHVGGGYSRQADQLDHTPPPSPGTGCDVQHKSFLFQRVASRCGWEALRGHLHARSFVGHSHMLSITHNFISTSHSLLVSGRWSTCYHPCIATGLGTLGMAPSKKGNMDNSSRQALVF